MKAPLFSNGDLAIAQAPKQFVDKIGNGNLRVARQSKAAEEAHSAATAFRPHSLATQ